MLARVAQTLFFMARDIERAETTARLLEVTQAMDLETERFARNGDGDWGTLVRSVSDYDAFVATYGAVDQSSVGWHVTLSEDNPDAIRWTVARARERARSVRDRLPSDVWEAINGLHLELADWDSARIGNEGLYVFCQLVRERLYLVLGLIDVCMRRDDHWTFLRLGRFLERARRVARMLEVWAAELWPSDSEIGAPVALHRWRALLQAAQADEAHAALRLSVSGESALRFLVLDDRFPRSVRFSLRVVHDCLGSLAEDLTLAEGSRPARITEDALEFVAPNRAGLLLGDPPYYLARAGRYCDEITDAIHTTCFAAGYPRRTEDSRVQAQGQSQN